MEKQPFPLAEIQKHIASYKEIDGWLLYDFRCRNTIATEFLGIDPTKLLSRRFFYWIPKSGSPIKVVHKIESDALAHLPGSQLSYESWQSLEQALISVLKGQTSIAMEHSPQGAIPVIAKLDAGMLEWLQSKNIHVSSSWPIVQHFTSRWTKEQLDSHKESSKVLIHAYKSSWELIRKSFLKSKKLFELDIQQHILEIFSANNMITDHLPIVAVGPHSALPHYAPSKTSNAEITQDSLLLIDLWAKKDDPSAPYADITQVAFFGKMPSSQMIQIYDAVWMAQKSAIDYLQTKLQQDKEVTGAEVDDVTRAVIRKAGYQDFFVHRTGHNIHTELHGMGPNIDNFETHDTRSLMSRTCYSIEPGIYLPSLFGIRLECNVFINENFTIEVTGQSLPQLPCF